MFISEYIFTSSHSQNGEKIIKIFKKFDVNKNEALLLDLPWKENSSSVKKYINIRIFKEFKLNEVFKIVLNR